MRISNSGKPNLIIPIIIYYDIIIIIATKHSLAFGV